MNIQILPIKNLIPYENNPRINDDAVSSVAASIKEKENKHYKKEEIR